MFASFRRRRPTPSSPPAKTRERRRGNRGEDLAAREAVARGWPVLARNHRCRTGELDLVLRDARTLVFVEVKSRRVRGYALHAVTRAKRRRLVLAALDYVARQQIDLGTTPCRFDVCEVWLNPNGPDELRWTSDAFSAEGLGLDL